MKRIIVFLVLISLGSIYFYGCTSNSQQEKDIKYVFYFIGDGMGFAQAHAAEMYLASKDKSNNFPFLHMNKLPYHNYFSTHAENRYITGSAAAGTAMSTGEKTTINTIGKNSDRSFDLNPISAKTKAAGMKVGIISSVSIDHATPASFYAHQDHRNMYYEIGLDLPKSGFEFFGGGGFRYPDGKNNDKDTNLIAFAQELGYKYITDKTEFLNLKPGNEKYLIINEKLDEGAAIPYSIDQNENDISLKNLISKAIELLDNEKGFFIMLESGKIDWACHQNDAVATIHDVIAFDEAIKVAMDFYEKNPNETLIIVTTDHETGGMALGNRLTGYDSDYALIDYQTASMDVLVEKLDAIENLTYEKALSFLKQELSLDDTVAQLKLTDYDHKRLLKAYNAKIDIKSVVDKYEAYDLYGGYDPFIVEALRVFNGKIGISFATWAHTGIPVPLKYVGIDPQKIVGHMDNTDLSKLLEDRLKLNQ